MISTKKRHPADYRLLLPLLLGGAWLRLWRLDGQSMWFDEAARLLIARADLRTILTTTGGDTLPPLFHLFMHFWQQMGTQDFWTRLPAALAGVLLIAVMYRSGAALADRKTGYLAAGSTALLPYLVFHAQQANLYSLYVLTAALQMWLFWRAAARPERKGRWAAYTAVTALALYLHYFIALLPIVQHLYLLLRDRRRVVWRSLISADLLIGGAYLPYVPIFWRKINEVSGGFWLTAPSPVQPLLTYTIFIGSYSLPGEAVMGVLGLVTALLLLTLLELRHHWRARTVNRDAVLFLLLHAFLPVAMVWIVSQWIPVYLDRTLLLVLPAFVLLLAYALRRTKRRSPLPYAGLLLLPLLFLSLGNYYLNPEYQKEDYRRAAQEIAAYRQENDVVIHTGNGSYIPFLLYLPPANHYLLDGDPTPHHPATVHEHVGGATITLGEMAELERFILVVALDHSVEYQQAAAAEIERTYHKMADISLSPIIIYVYE